MWSKTILRTEKEHERYKAGPKHSLLEMIMPGPRFWSGKKKFKQQKELESTSFCIYYLLSVFITCQGKAKRHLMVPF